MIEAKAISGKKILFSEKLVRLAGIEHYNSNSSRYRANR